MNTKELVCLAARLADGKKAENIKVIDLGGLSSLCDYILIATATSKPHLDAVEEEISKKLKELGYYKLNRDGGDSNLWRVSDYGGFLAHVMTQEARDFYALDKIFSFGKKRKQKKLTQKKQRSKKRLPKKQPQPKRPLPPNRQSKRLPPKKQRLKKPFPKKPLPKKRPQLKRPPLKNNSTC